MRMPVITKLGLKEIEKAIKQDFKLLTSSGVYPQFVSSLILLGLN